MWTGHEIDAAIYGYTPLVRRIAFALARKMPASVEVDDLVQSGMIGLLEAATRFDPDDGTPFEGFATQRIRGEMLDELRRHDWVPRVVRRARRDIEQAITTTQHRTGRATTSGEVAAQLQIPVDRYHALHVLSDRVDQVHDEADRADDALGPPAKLDAKRFDAAFVDAMRALPGPHRTVMSLYYAHELNFAAIGETMGFTESRACQIHSQAVKRLRQGLMDYAPG